MRTRIASAGTGKTTALVQEILSLIAAGTPLRRIGAVTFTRKAATEFRTRIAEALTNLTNGKSVLSIHANDISEERLREATAELDANTIGTIHALMRRLITITAPELRIDPNFTLIGEHESRTIFTQELTTLKYLQEIHLSDAQEQAITELFTQRSLSATPHTNGDESTEELIRIFTKAMMKYRQRLGDSRFSPSDLEHLAITAANDPTITRAWQKRVTHVIIDEAQDLNPTQATFMHALEQAGIDITIVGDPKQSIYGFRHADVDSFRRITENTTHLEPLTTTYRHAMTINRFLNRFTETVANNTTAFTNNENPPITTARDEPGTVTIHWITGDKDTRIDDLRKHEATKLANELRTLHENGIPYHHMSILTRSRSSQEPLTSILTHHKIPHIIIQGRNYYAKTEIRDLYHALKFIHDQNPYSLTVTLTSPFGNLDTNSLHETLTQPNPIEHLQRHHPTTHATIQHLLTYQNKTPRDTLHGITYDNIIDGHSYAAALTEEQNDNIDTIMTLLNPSTHANLNHLTAAFKDLFGQEEAGDVPQSGDGVRITTIHASKGLEWPVTAVFDLGRSAPNHNPLIITDPETGLTATIDSEHYSGLLERHQRRETNELHRLMYVAYSRARDHLIITGSIKNGKNSAAIGVLSRMNVGPGTNLNSKHVRITSFDASEAPVPNVTSVDEGTLPTRYPETTFTHVIFPHALEPLVRRPSHATGTDSSFDTEKRYDGEGNDEIITEAAIVGTLTHHAIGERWSPADPTTIQSLAAQAILAPLPAVTKQKVLGEAMHLLEHHDSMVGTVIPDENTMQESHREVPFTYRDEHDVTWNGIIDHLYRIGNDWFIHDYKTDHTIRPDAHTNQMRLYQKAVRERFKANANVTAQLVYLRHRSLVTIPMEGDAVVVELPSIPVTVTPASMPATRRRRKTTMAAQEVHG